MRFFIMNNIHPYLAVGEYIAIIFSLAGASDAVFFVLTTIHSCSLFFLRQPVQ